MEPRVVEGFKSKSVKLIPATELMFEARKIRNEDEWSA